MCTLTLAWQLFPDAPVVVAANRDERLERRSEPPRRRDWERPVVAPLDLEAGGTWIGYNDDGVLVAVTNRWTETDLDGERSRGLLVRDALNHDSAAETARYVERELDCRRYEGFNLLVADAASAVLIEWDGHRRVETLRPGVHVVVNVGADGRYAVPERRTEEGREQAQNADSVRAALAPEPGESSREWLDRAGGVVSDHEYGVCVHGDGFGTRSSSLIRLTETGATYEYADGPPCRTAFERVGRESAGGGESQV